MPLSPRLAAGWARRQAGLPNRGHSRGFTLIELILVIVITAALAVFALPKVVDTTLWRLRAFGDELQSRHQAMLRLALQQRRPIVETLSATGVSWAYGNGTAIATLPCPATESPCIAEGGSRTVTFNSANSGATTTSSAADLTVTVAHSSYSQAYVIAADTGLIYPLP
ncbi:type II secretion system protein [Pelomonas sp. P7]|uniref:Type II secretion system protein n=1 Tax=Pelomonas caseinilytica TaxID=2906763 RepID=A0ABS8XEP9_9BURK|nr:prepilin-type N-terminal cleavage/methylation domain-containing protein [Pelomonas sp. P7]MCE4539389.1 type II secretion system protein [Pelomonas sp. P7]